MTTRSTLLALAVLAFACSTQTPDDPPWLGLVDADIDDLTGQRTGLFRTYGPTSLLIGGSDTIPVTVGYYCEIDEHEVPLVVTDGLFFKVSMPDTSLTQGSDREIEELQGTLGLLDVARLSVDGNVVAWRYRAVPSVGAWHLDGDNGFNPPQFETGADSLESTLVSMYQSLQRSASNRLSESLERRLTAIVDSLRVTWPEAHDYVNTNYRGGRSSAAVELARVVQFDMSGFDAAVDSVRFWCPAPQSHHEWNARRRAFFDSIAAARESTIAARDAAAAAAQRRAEEARRQAAAEAARRDSIRATREARQDSIREASEARRRAQVEARRAVSDARVRLRDEVVERLDITTQQFLFLRSFADRAGIELSGADDVAGICREILRRLRARGDPRLQRSAPAPLREPCMRIVGGE